MVQTGLFLLVPIETFSPDRTEFGWTRCQIGTRKSELCVPRTPAGMGRDSAYALYAVDECSEKAACIAVIGAGGVPTALPYARVCSAHSAGAIATARMMARLWLGDELDKALRVDAIRLFDGKLHETN